MVYRDMISPFLFLVNDDGVDVDENLIDLYPNNVCRIVHEYAVHDELLIFQLFLINFHTKLLYLIHEKEVQRIHSRTELVQVGPEIR